MSYTFSRVDVSCTDKMYDFCLRLREEKAGVSFARVSDRDELMKWLTDCNVFMYGVFENDKLVGIFKAERGEPGKEHSCYIAGAVEKPYRGQGLGKKLLTYSLDQLKANDIWMIRAKVYSTNTASIASLLSAGFVWSGTIYKHQWDSAREQYIDDLIFHKEL